MAKCPICKAKLNLKDVTIGKLDKKGCPSCGAKLRPNKVHTVITTMIAVIILQGLWYKVHVSNPVLFYILVILLYITAICVGSLISGYKPIDD